MFRKQEIIAKSKQAIIEFNDIAAKQIAREALEAGIEPAELIEEGFTKAMETVGEQFAEGRLFLPHVIAAADAMEAAMDVLSPEMEVMNDGTGPMVTIVIGTIEGDIHSIGKDIVAMALKIAGYNVVDLGRDVPIGKYVEAAKEFNADVVASSALMTITMANQERIEEELREEGIRNSVRTMVGGAPVSRKWADRIGADIYAEDAADAVEKINTLFS